MNKIKTASFATVSPFPSPLSTLRVGVVLHYAIIRNRLCEKLHNQSTANFFSRCCGAAETSAPNTFVCLQAGFGLLNLKHLTKSLAACTYLGIAKAS